MTWSSPSAERRRSAAAASRSGKGIANPIASFWSGSMMLEHLGEPAAPARLLRAIERTTADKSLHRPDLGGKATTRAVTKAVCAALAGDNG